ncbi:MAG TPA: tryptophan--tRNA ligase [Actinomycetota bacterium]|jgi:tryptophanyl-tRNA synthetase|nr:tryptophan--tRNA ligase [Actinomycetota bacterium]
MHDRPAATAVTGIQPSGRLHLGNYLGMVLPLLEISAGAGSYVFLADMHALTTQRDAERVRRMSADLAATLLALGLAETGAVLYRQSDVPEVGALSWLLACALPKGRLNRMHAYKAVVAENRKAGRHDDHGVSAGVYYYPLLMAADIVALGADVVPVGADQKQHVEIAQACAIAFNNRYGDVLTVPRESIAPGIETVPGTDGNKMSKSRDNVVPVMAKPAELRQIVSSIVTDSRGAGAPKDPSSCTVFALYALMAGKEEVDTMRRRYLDGSITYAEAKSAVVELLENRFAPARARHRELLCAPEHIEDVLRAGAAAARPRIRAIAGRAFEAAGLSAAAFAEPHPAG